MDRNYTEISFWRKTILMLGVTLPMVFASCSKDSGKYNQLDGEITRKPVYEAQKISRIARLSDSIFCHRDSMEPGDLYRAYNTLYQEYESFQFDSAYKYSVVLKDIAKILQDPSMLVDSKIKYGYILSKGGLFKESLDSLIINDIDRFPVSDSLKNQYYITLGRIYHHLSDYTNDHTFTALYNRKGNEALKKALLYCRDSLEIYWIRGKTELKESGLEAARTYYKYAVDHFELNDPMAAILYSTLASIENKMGNYDQAIDYYMISAGINIRNSTTENGTFQGLANILFYQKGETAKAALFINLALEDANSFSSRQRKLKIAELLPVIIDEKINDIEHKKIILERSFIIIALLAVLLIILFIIALVQMQRLRESRTFLRQVNANLLESNHIKEQYIGHYFHINSTLIDRMNRFSKLALRKMEHQQYADLQSMIRNLDESAQKEAIYKDFDRTFLSLFPTFVKDFNALLKPADRITVPEKSMNTSLRIFALIRLGITESEQIAHILDYSLNTIYNYRTRIRNKSMVPSDEFEHIVRKIGTF